MLTQDIVKKWIRNKWTLVYVVYKTTTYEVWGIDIILVFSNLWRSEMEIHEVNKGLARTSEMK